MKCIWGGGRGRRPSVSPCWGRRPAHGGSQHKTTKHRTRNRPKTQNRTLPNRLPHHSRPVLYIAGLKMCAYTIPRVLRSLGKSCLCCPCALCCCCSSTHRPRFTVIWEFVAAVMGEELVKDPD